LAGALDWLAFHLVAAVVDDFRQRSSGMSKMISWVKAMIDLNDLPMKT